MTYVDGYVLAVPIANKEAYIKQAEIFAGIALKNGAVSTMESWQDDVPEGKQTDFFKAVDCQPGEAIVFAWTIWPSKEARDAGTKAMMDDPEFTSQMSEMPFDGKRMIYGSFETFLEH
ncbi:MAG: DUF1428 domain-containing protein [Pseudomonadota bacterium]